MLLTCTHLISQLNNKTVGVATSGSHKLKYITSLFIDHHREHHHHHDHLVVDDRTLVALISGLVKWLLIDIIKLHN